MALEDYLEHRLTAIIRTSQNQINNPIWEALADLAQCIGLLNETLAAAPETNALELGARARAFPTPSSVRDGEVTDKGK